MILGSPRLSRLRVWDSESRDLHAASKAYGLQFKVYRGQNNVL